MSRGRRTIPGAAGVTFASLLSVVSAGSQAGQGQNPQMAEDVLANVQVLKGIPVDEFMDTMGMFAAALGADCTDCHVSDIVFRREAFAEPTPRIQRARQMILMMNGINQANFGGATRVTCFTCHNGSPSPKDVPSLEIQYGTPPDEPNAMELFPFPGPSAAESLETYVQALGGAERAAGVTSFVARGTYAGFETGFAEVPLEIFARAPDQRTMIAHLANGENVKTYDGRNGWFSGPGALAPVTTLTGGNLANARTEAIVAFPAGIQDAFSEWQSGGTVIDGRPVRVVQGSNPGQLPVNLYFDDSGLLVRVVRWNDTAVGRVPTQVDYDDYREVAGVQMLFRRIETWTNGQTTIALTEVQPNAQIDAARFARPASPPGR